MKNIILEKLVITNFKGIQSLDIPFSHETFIHGANGTGKTSVCDAFMWLMFGKNSEEKKEFSIKPIVTVDGHVSASPGKTENEVIGHFLVDGKPEVLKRIQREKWVKSRGESEEKFTGNETLFFWNDVPCQAGEYQRRVSELIDEKLFKLITSPYAFAGLNWTERRSIITGIVGDVSDDDVAASRQEFRELLNALSGKSLEDFRKEVSAKKKKLREELDLIPARIDELRRSMPQAPDATMIEIDINNIEAKITDCNNRIKDVSKAAEGFNAQKLERNKRIGEINQLLFNKVEGQRSAIRSAFSKQTQERQSIERTIREIEQEIKSSSVLIQKKEDVVASIDLQLPKLRDEWAKINNEVIQFNEDDFCCPTCKRSFDVSLVEEKQAEMTANFNRRKAERLTAIQTEGKTKTAEKEAILAEISGMKESVEMQTEILQGKKNEFAEMAPPMSDYDINIQAQKNCLADDEYKQLSDELDRLNQINDMPFSESGDTSSIEAERKELEGKRDALKLRLKDQEVIDRTNVRITELNDQARGFSQQIADLEKTIFTAESFERLKYDLVEDRVNELFTRLKFRMYKQNINGSIEPACEILINGVPFSDANTASQINAGIEIINILCKSYNVSAPIFVDGRESVTEIIPTESQLINLVVDPSSKVLTIK